MLSSHHRHYLLKYLKKEARAKLHRQWIFRPNKDEFLTSSLIDSAEFQNNHKLIHITFDVEERGDRERVHVQGGEQWRFSTPGPRASPLLLLTLMGSSPPTQVPRVDPEPLSSLFSCSPPCSFCITSSIPMTSVLPYILPDSHIQTQTHSEFCISGHRLMV